MHIPEAELLIRRLPGVSGCRIRSDPAGRPTVVHVTVLAGSNPVELAAAVVTVLAAEAGLDVDPSQVQVVSLPASGSETSSLAPAVGASATAAPGASAETPVLEELEQDFRPRLVALNLMVTEERSVAEVELAQGPVSALGRAESRGAGSAPELLAEACLDALEKICGARVSLRLVASHVTRLGPADVCSVLVQETEGRTERLHVGACEVRGDASRAAAYAALDSMNRRLGRILVGPPVHYDIS